MKTSSLPPKSAAKAGSETRTAFAAACALYLPCLTLAVWGASLAPASSSVGAEGIMLAVAQFESAAAAPATAAEPAAAPAAAPVTVSAPAAPAEPALLVVGRDGDPFLGEVREAVLSTLEYPREARRMRRQGTVTVQFVIGPDGRVSGISVHEGSGHDMLDREACAAVARVASLWGSPGRTVRIRMPVVFTLKKGRG